MNIVEKVENDFRKLGRPCPSCGKRPFLVLFREGNGFVCCSFTECERNARVEKGNNFDYGDAMGRALRAWWTVSTRRD